MHDLPPPFRIEIQPDGESVVVRPVGELDIATSAEVHKRAEELRARGFRHILLDLREVSFCDSTGLRMLAELDAESRADGFVLELVDAQGAVARILDLTGMREVFRFARTLVT